LSSWTVAGFLSGRNFSLKEMETSLVAFNIMYMILSGQEGTSLWKRWKLESIKYLATSLSMTVRKELLSERDGNMNLSLLVPLHFTASQEGTSLWKRWKLSLRRWNFFCTPHRSGRNFSLKEMETLVGRPDDPGGGPPVRKELLSERDGNIPCGRITKA